MNPRVAPLKRSSANPWCAPRTLRLRREGVPGEEDHLDRGVFFLGIEEELGAQADLIGLVVPHAADDLVPADHAGPEALLGLEEALADAEGELEVVRRPVADREPELARAVAKRVVGDVVWQDTAYAQSQHAVVANGWFALTEDRKNNR